MTANAAPTHNCGVCGLAPGKVYDSAIGPTSYAFCETCLEEGAESIGVICLWIFLQGGPKGAEKNIPGNILQEIKSYAEGGYIGWPEILAIYPGYEAQFRN